MRIFLILRFALRFLISRKIGTFSSYASWLAIGGLSIGVASLMLTASIIQGFTETVSEKLSNFEGAGRVTHILGRSINLSDTTITSLIKNNNKIITPFIRGVCIFRFQNKAEGVLIEGVEKLPEVISQFGKININSGEIIIGKGLASKMGIRLDDIIYLQGFSDRKSTFSMPKVKSLKITQIYESGLQEYDNTLAYLSLEDSRSILNYDKNEITGLIINASNIKNLPYPYYYETWKERHALLFEWISIQKWPAYLMFALIILVGIVNLIAAITMIIIEKSNQIGILLAQGMPKIGLKQIFMLQGGFIGFAGGVIGGFISILIILVQLKFELLEIPSDIYFMDKIPFSFNYIVFVFILIFSFSISLIASWIPINRISNFKPSKALRYE